MVKKCRLSDKNETSNGFRLHLIILAAIGILLSTPSYARSMSSIYFPPSDGGGSSLGYYDAECSDDVAHECMIISFVCASEGLPPGIAVDLYAIEDKTFSKALTPSGLPYLQGLSSSSPYFLRNAGITEIDGLWEITASPSDPETVRDILQSGKVEYHFGDQVFEIPQNSVSDTNLNSFVSGCPIQGNGV